MFKDARALDRQYTQGSFRLALTSYRRAAEHWYDGTVDSVDARLATCSRLLHAVRAGVARMPLTDAVPFLRAADQLESDKRALVALHEDLLSGASGRADVTGPPGWRLAQTPMAKGLPSPAPRTVTPGGANMLPTDPGNTPTGPPAGAPTAPPTAAASPQPATPPITGSRRLAGIPEGYVDPSVEGFERRHNIPARPRPAMGAPNPVDMSAYDTHPDLKPPSTGERAQKVPPAIGQRGMDPRIQSGPYDPADFERRTQQTHDYINQRHPDLLDPAQAHQEDPEDIENRERFTPAPAREPYAHEPITPPGVSPQNARWFEEYPHTTEPMPQEIFNDINDTPPWHKDYDRSTKGQSPRAQAYWDMMHERDPQHAERLQREFRQSSLSGTDRRWVTLEAAKFVAANPDTYDDSHELATRAHHYAAIKTSSFTPVRSASICEAFVARVGELGSRAVPEPIKPIRRVAGVEDIDPSAMYL